MNLDTSNMTRQEKLRLLEVLTEMDRRESRNAIKQYFPTAGVRAQYAKQMQFFRLGTQYTERALFGGNRSGKTVAGGYEDVLHLTGLYPEWWEGRRFDHPVDAWTAGDTAKNVRDIMQRLLLGKPGDPSAFGTGLIPGELIKRTTPKQGVADAIESVFVKHVPTGGVSQLQFKSYDQGREAFQGTTQDFIHLDEEPPIDVYTECLLRLMTSQGSLILTATPLQGLTKLMLQYLPDMAPADDSEQISADDRASKTAVMVSWEDVPHLDAKTKAAILASIPPWQRDARSKGIPQLGAGAIFQVPESDIKVVPFPIPPHWLRSYGMDVGWKRTAGIWAAQDPDTGVIYLNDEYYRGQAEPSVHAAAFRNRGAWIPGVIDPAARGRSQIDGQKLFDIYRELGLDLWKANNAREAGIYAVWELFSQGRLKVFSSCANVFSEYRLYRRDERGNIVKENDHLMDAIRYLVMSGLTRGIPVPNLDPNGKKWFDWSPPPVWAG